MATNLVNDVQRGGQRQDGRDVHVLAAGLREPGAVEEHPEPCALHLRDQLGEVRHCDAARLHQAMVERPIVDQGPQHRQQFEIHARANLQETVRGPCARRLTNVDHDHPAIVPACWHMLALRRERVFRQMARVGLDRVGSPVDQQVRMVLDLAQRARDLADQLCADLAGPMRQGGVAIDNPANLFGQFDGRALRLGRGVAQAIDQRQVGASSGFPQPGQLPRPCWPAVHPPTSPGVGRRRHDHRTRPGRACRRALPGQCARRRYAVRCRHIGSHKTCRSRSLPPSASLFLRIPTPQPNRVSELNQTSE